MKAVMRRSAAGLLLLAATLFIGWRGWWVPNDLVLAHNLRGATAVRIIFHTYEHPTQQPVATLAGRAAAPLVQALDRPLHFAIATPGCGDWFEVTFERADGTSYSLSYHHGARAGTLVYHKGAQVGSARAPQAFREAMAAIVEPFLAQRADGCHAAPASTTSGP